MTSLAVIVLAAGQGLRMKSDKQKIMHQVGGRPMVAHVFAAVEEITDIQPLVVIGPGADEVRDLLGNRAEYIVQSQQLGTGHATLMARSSLEGRTDQVLVAYADMPLLRAKTMAQLARKQAETSAAVSLLTVEGDSSSSFGRIIRRPDGQVSEIIEVAEAKLRADNETILAISELNVGVYCFDSAWLWQFLPALPTRQARSGPEYYLTDMVGLAVEQGHRVEAVVAAEASECLSAGTRADMVRVERAFRQRVNNYWLDNGVTLVDPETIFIDQEVDIGRDTILWPSTYIQGMSRIGAGCIIGPNTIIRNAQIGERCRIEQAFIEDATIYNDMVVEPFTVIRNQ